MNSRRQAFMLAGALTATVFTAVAAFAGVSRHAPLPAAARLELRSSRSRRHPAATALQVGGRLMRRVWAAVVSVWATLAIVAGLAWTRQPPARSRLSPPAARHCRQGQERDTAFRRGRIDRGSRPARHDPDVSSSAA